MPLSLPPLYVICDADVCARAGWRLTDFANACLAGGARLLQVRAKTLSSGEFLTASESIVGMARPAGATVIINDRADIARLSGADGVHIGQDDLPPFAVRRVVGGDAVVGLSTHSAPQLEAACDEPVSYLAVGPIFTTATKATGYEPQGLDVVRAAAVVAQAHGLPLVAIGGITLSRARSVIDAGAQSVAAVSDLLVAGDPAARVREYVRALC
jgi:thiamine-phosphate pyrophosphorylase